MVVGVGGLASLGPHRRCQHLPQRRVRGTKDMERTAGHGALEQSKEVSYTTLPLYFTDASTVRIILLY